MITDKGHVKIAIQGEGNGFNRANWNRDEKKFGERVYHYLLNNNLVIEVADASGNYKCFRTHIDAVSLLVDWYKSCLNTLQKEQEIKDVVSTTYNKEKISLTIEGNLKGDEPFVKFTVEDKDGKKTARLLYNNASPYQLSFSEHMPSIYIVNALKQLVDNVEASTKVNSPVMNTWRKETYEARQKKKGNDNNYSSNSNDASEFE